MELSTPELLMLLGKLYVEKEIVLGERDSLRVQLAEKESNES